MINIVVTFSPSLLLFFICNAPALVRDIHWAQGEPGGGTSQNFVAIRPLVKDFDDLEHETQVCVSCEIEYSKQFILRGVPKNSFFETKLFPKICGGYIGFIGNVLSIWYVINFSKGYSFPKLKMYKILVMMRKIIGGLQYTQDTQISWQYQIPTQC